MTRNELYLNALLHRIFPVEGDFDLADKYATASQDIASKQNFVLSPFGNLKKKDNGS